MFERDIYTIHSTYREDMRIKGFQFGANLRRDRLAVKNFCHCYIPPNR